MGIEIDMLKVGNADAIALRYVYSDGTDFVAVIDGAYKQNAEQIANIIETQYKRSYIDLMVSTHPDQDHVSGLTALLDLMRVKKVWVHDPSMHSASVGLSLAKIAAYMRSTGMAVVKSMDDLEQFINAVDSKGIPREEPFLGSVWGPLEVLGPSRAFYEERLLETAADEGFAKSVRLELEQDIDPYTDYAIDENSATTPSNNTSTIIKVIEAGRSFLFTGDAGVQAFTSASRSCGFSNLYWFQVPHHGSKRNLSTPVVEYVRPTVAFASAEGDAKHPSRAAVNALKRVNTRVYSTHKSGSLWEHNGLGVPDSRPNYTTAEPL